jgi:uncharacterized protein
MIKRDVAPDVLRGFALLGILVVNIQFMGLSSAEGARGDWTQGFANGSATFLIAALFAGKFYLLFSFLFGYSSNYVIRNDKSNRARWIKRCLVLIGFGALHFTFLWHGDIIFVYGLFGLLLTFFFFRADRTLKIWSRIVFFVSTFFIILIGALALTAEYLLEEDLGSSTVLSLDEILRSGTFLESIPARLEVWVLSISSGIFLQGGLAFAAFLVGVRLARSNFLSSPLDKDANSRLVKKGLVFGLPIQVIAAVILLQNEQSAEPSESVYLISLFVSFVTAPLLSMFYVGVIRKLVEEKPNLVIWMMPAGKMSLTIYISQSVLTSLIFGPWGLGLFQALQTWQVFLLAFAIWLLLSYIAAQWLKKFNQGPFEKLVSSLTRNR